MEITEYFDGGSRCPCWKLPNLGWEDLSNKLDDYLSECIRSIAAAYPDKPVEWVELNYWPDTGRLIVYSSDDPFDRTERVCFQLFSDYLQQEFDQICEMPDEQRQAEWDALGEKLWDRVGECLVKGQAHGELLTARTSHPMKLAAFDYTPGEGLFHLLEIDPTASADINQQLTDFKRRYEIDG